VDVGLVDGIAHLRPKMVDLFGDKVVLQAYGQRRGLLSRLGLAAADQVIGAVEDRAAWARFGL
jgi:serine protease SohB